MAEIIPAILPRNYEDLKNKIALVRRLVPVVQIDICDGVFVKSITWPFISAGKRQDLENSKRSCLEEAELDPHFQRILNEKEGLPFWEDVDFELDLMVKNPIENFDVYLKLGARRIVFHFESIEDGDKFQQFLEGIDPYIRDTVSIGLALNIGTPIAKIFPLVPLVEFVQVMGIDVIGVQGEDFDSKCLETIKTLKEKFPDLTVSVDGGVDLETALSLTDLGADRLVVGSAIFNSDDIIETIETFKSY